jgi:hypothetical protein
VERQGQERVTPSLEKRGGQGVSWTTVGKIIGVDIWRQLRIKVDKHRTVRFSEKHRMDGRKMRSENLFPVFFKPCFRQEKDFTEKRRGGVSFQFSEL